MAHLFVICGHGAGDCGAVGNGYTEADLVRKLGQRIKDLGGDNVTLADTSRNWYADNGISSLSISKDWQIVELHMDSASASARGGHVIIKAGIGGADKYDKALAESITSIFPGRSNSIVERSDLANPNRAYRKGYGYRLVENGFITNEKDVKIFIDKMDEVAKAYLAAFENDAATTTTTTTTITETVSSGIAIDGSWGQATTKAMQKALGTTQDGIVSGQYKSDKAALPNCSATSWKWDNSGTGSQMVRALQSKVGSAADGFAGKNTVKALQTWLNARGYGLSVDGSCGPATVKAVQTALNKGQF